METETESAHVREEDAPSASFQIIKLQSIQTRSRSRHVCSMHARPESRKRVVLAWWITWQSSLLLGRRLRRRRRRRALAGRRSVRRSTGERRCQVLLLLLLLRWYQRLNLVLLVPIPNPEERRRWIRCHGLPIYPRTNSKTPRELLFPGRFGLLLGLAASFLALPLRCEQARVPKVRHRNQHRQQAGIAKKQDAHSHSMRAAGDHGRKKGKNLLFRRRQIDRGRARQNQGERAERS